MAGAAAAPGAPQAVFTALGSAGSRLDASARSFLEPRFGHDFGSVRIHTDQRADSAARAVQARAFTFGRDIVFGQGEYAPDSRAGQQLLAHELAHVVQQGAAPRLGAAAGLQRASGEPLSAGPASADSVLLRKPKTPRFYNACNRVLDHKHAPTGTWTKQQPAWRKSCGAAEANAAKVARDLTRGKLPSLSSLRVRSVVECACGNLDPAAALDAARHGTMIPGGRASQFLDHYLDGKGADLQVDVRRLLLEDEGVRKRLASVMKVSARGCVFIRQSDYSSHDWKFALGGIDRMDYEVDPAAQTVHLWFRDRYQWHPEDKARPSNCIHIAAVELKSSGAADFWMIGDAVVPQSWFSTGPTFLEWLFP
jgi:hypothetical protein